MKTPHEMAAVGKEFSEQTALFAWAAMARNFGPEIAGDPLAYAKPEHIKTYIKKVPLGEQWCNPIVELKWLHAIKNQGHGDAIRGARSAAEGVRPGVFDVFLPVASHNSGYIRGPNVPLDQQAGLGKFHGLYVELKTVDRRNHKDGGASQVQLDFQADIRAAGYEAWVCHGWEEARVTILRYLGRA